MQQLHHSFIGYSCTQLSSTQVLRAVCPNGYNVFHVPSPPQLQVFLSLFFSLWCLTSPLLAHSRYLLLMLFLNDFPSLRDGFSISQLCSAPDTFFLTTSLSNLCPSLLHLTFPPLSSFPAPLPSAALPWHATWTEERGVGSEWVHVASMTNADRACFAALGMKLPKEWQPHGPAASHLVVRLARLYKVCMGFQSGRRCTVFHKFITWPDLGKFTQYKAQSLYEYYLYTKFWRNQNISKAQFSIFLFRL